jgi:hypothetical protein
MQTNRSLLRIAARTAAFSFLVGGAVSVMQAQQAAPASSAAPFQLAESKVPLNFTLSPDATLNGSSSSSLSSNSDALANDPASLGSSFDVTQPPPRRRYGRPNYADSHTNADGSSKFAFMAGAGLVSPVQNTGIYLTPSWVFQVGAGRNFSKKFGVMFQFDWNNFGFQNQTVANQIKLYNAQIAAYNATPAGILNPATPFSQIGGSSHVWSFSLDPTFTFYGGEKWGAYAVGGAGFFHKTANFTTPTVQTYCDYLYGCVQYQANASVDSYTSNAFGIDGGLGLTYKPSQFSGQKFYLEARYVFVDNSPRPATNNNLYPPNANQTYYVPVTFGLRF